MLYHVWLFLICLMEYHPLTQPTLTPVHEGLNHFINSKWQILVPVGLVIFQVVKSWLLYNSSYWKFDEANIFHTQITVIMVNWWWIFIKAKNKVPEKKNGWSEHFHIQITGCTFLSPPFYLHANQSCVMWIGFPVAKECNLNHSFLQTPTSCFQDRSQLGKT